MEVFIIFIIVGAIGAGIGAIIDGGRGALWGFFLGPVGWIIAAVLKGKCRPRWWSGWRRSYL